MTGKKLPERSCMGCGAKKSKRELLRIVRSPDGSYAVDSTGKMPGRGAYICKDPACLKELCKNHGLNRSFKENVDNNIFDKLEKFFIEAKSAHTCAPEGG